MSRCSMAYAKMNKNKEAEEAYKNALRLDPDNADYQNNLSVTQQRIQEGIAIFDLFSSLRPLYIAPTFSSSFQ